MSVLHFELLLFVASASIHWVSDRTIEADITALPLRDFNAEVVVKPIEKERGIFVVRKSWDEQLGSDLNCTDSSSECSSS